MNHIAIIGNLGKDPESRFTPTGKRATTFSVAINHRWTDSEGQKKEDTTWVNVECWNGLGENCAKFLAKGRKVLVEGRLSIRPYEDKEGAKRDWVTIVASNVEFLDAPRTEAAAPQQPTENIPF